jgi:Transmembrane domain of unknown function (DUF3566)
MAQTTDPTPAPSEGPQLEPSPGMAELTREAAPPAADHELPDGAVISSKRAPKQSPKRTRVVVRKVGPWSVLKLSLIFYFVVMLIGWGALLIVYGILGASGAIKSVTDLSTQIGLWNPTTNAPPTINGKAVFTWLFIGGVIAVIIWSIINFLIALAYNLVSDVVGGLELTLAESRHRDEV